VRESKGDITGGEGKTVQRGKKIIGVDSKARVNNGVKRVRKGRDKSATDDAEKNKLRDKEDSTDENYPRKKAFRRILHKSHAL